MIPRVRLKWRGTASANNITAGLKGGIALITFCDAGGAGSVLIYDAATATGTPIVSLAATGGTANWGDGSVLLQYDTGLSTTIAGVTPIVSIYEPA